MWKSIVYTIPYNTEFLLWLLLYFKLEFQTQVRLRVPSSKELETVGPFALGQFSTISEGMDLLKDMG